MIAPKAADLRSVIDGDWCVGCGACTGVDDTLRLELDPDSGSYRPTGPGDVRSAAVCPAVAVDADALTDELFPGTPKGPYGAVDEVWLAQNCDADENRASSSGGIVRPLLRHLLESGQVSGVIALGEASGFDYDQQLFESTDSLARLPASIYHVVEHSSLYRHLREAEGSLAVVGIPCQLEGLHLFLRSPEGSGLRDKVALTVGLFCGWQYTMHGVRALGKYKRFDVDDVTRVRYRGGGPVGKLRIDLANGGQRRVNRRVSYPALVAFDRSFNLSRCQICVNHSNFLADIALGDAWLPETVASRSGVSIVVTRNQRASGLLRDLQAKGALRLADATTDVILRSQGRAVAFGDFAYALADHLETRGDFVPLLNAPNRPAHRPTDRDEVRRMWQSIGTKRDLQRRGRYWHLWLRKATRELPEMLKRLWRSRLIRRYLDRGRPARTDQSTGIDLHDFT